MKIVYVSPSVGMSGGVAVIFQHANRLRRRGHDVSIAVENKREVDWFPGLQAPVISLDEYPNDVDVLVATGWQTSYGVVDLPARKKFYFVQSDETRFHPEGPLRDLTALSYRLNFNYLTEARWIQKWLLDNFGHESELIPNGLDTEIFHLTEPLEPKGTKPRILLEGTIALPSKGMADAFAAVADLDAEVWCVSTYGKPQPGWKCDRFFERVPMIEMKRIYSSCDVFLKLSRVEGFFGPPMEMMACGGAVVAGKVSGYDEYIVDGYNALTVDLGDVAAARDAVAKVISDGALRNKLIANGFETAKQWLWEPSIDRLERYYLDVLAGQRGKTDSVVKQSADRAISQAQRSLSLNQNPQALTAQLAEKDALLASIYASTAWRLIQSLWRIRMALLPHGSRRERLWLRAKNGIQKFFSRK